MDDSNMTSPECPESMFRAVGDAEVSLDEMLSLACRQGKQDIVELLLESGAKVNYRNKAGNTPLLEACSQGHVIIARLLLDKKADIDAPTETTSDSALTWACTLGNEDIVELLLENRAAIEHRTRDGCTALMFAALAGHDKVARLLLIHGAELNVESDSNKDSPLTFACWKGHQRVVELFLAHGANIEHRTKEGFSPLMFAALGGHTEVARLLLEKQAEVNQPSGSNNDIPLTSACWKGHHNVVELLLHYESNIEHHTKDGCTPLMLAAREGHLSVAQLLLNHCAKANIPSGSENNIPLTLACWKGHKDVVELLLSYNSNIEHQNKAGCTPLMLAAREGHFEATELLLDHQANLNIPSGSNDDTPLTLACWKGHEGVVKLLLERQSSINHQTKTGCTPLMEATREGHVVVARMLLEGGAEVETPDNYGQTPFFMACWKGHAEVASLLLEFGANKDCKTKTGITPFFQACRENHVEVVKLLLDYGCNPGTPFPNSRECPLTLAAEKGFVELAQVLLSRNANVECRTKKGFTPLFLTCKEGFKEIAVMLAKHGAETEATDQRGVTPLLAAFKNGHIDVVEWLLGHVAHLPSDMECQKALMAPKPSEKDVLPQRSKCLELIMKEVNEILYLRRSSSWIPNFIDFLYKMVEWHAKKAREQAALKNAQSLFEELDAEREKKETKRKAAARKRTKRKERKKKEQAGKNTETGSHKEEDEEDYEEEEEEEEGNKNNMDTSNYNHHPDHPLSEEEESIPHSIKRRSKRSKKKHNSQVSAQTTPTSSSTSITDSRRTSLQTPIQHIVDSWEEEESEDELYVDAPEFLPDSTSSNNSVSANIVKNSVVSEDSKKSLLLDQKFSNFVGGLSSFEGGVSSRKPPKPVSKIPKTRTVSKSEEGRITGVVSSSRKNTRTTQNTRTHSDIPCWTGDTPPKPPGDRKGKDKRTNSGTKSPDVQKNKVWGRTDPGSNSPLNNIHRPSSTGSSDFGRGSPVVQDDDEEESWDSQLEPTSEWSNEEKNEGFRQQSSRTKSWASVTTTTPPVSTSNSTMSTPPSTNKQWHEVSRAITTFQMTVSNSLVGRIIGKKGLKINQIQADSGAQISISRAIPRSVERLVTIKGTERSVKIARELIEEALSTPSKDIDVPPTTQEVQSQSQDTSQPSSQTVQTVSQSSTNPWNQSQPPASVWGQKRHSDVVPPSLSLLRNVGQEEKQRRVGVTMAMRRISLPAHIHNYELQSITSSNDVRNNNKEDNSEHDCPMTIALTTSSTSTTVSSSLAVHTGVIKSSPSPPPPPPPSSSPPPHHSSLTSGSLSRVNEKDEDEEDVPKHKRSLSEPAVTPSTINQISPTGSLTHSTSPLSLPSVTTSRYSPTMPSILSPSENESTTSSSTPSSTQPLNSQVGGVAVPTDPLVAISRTKTVGIVTPTQVKPVQRDTNPSITVSTSSSSFSDHYPPPMGNFGAIGPPSRRSSLPVTTAGHYDTVSPRKYSYAGIPLVPHVGGSLGMVPESHTMTQREYSWSNNSPHSPSLPNTWNNHAEWSGFVGHENERVRSQSWAGLAPGHSHGFGGHHHPMDYPPNGTPLHFDGPSRNHIPPVPPIHTSWGKYQSGPNPTHFRPPYPNRPHSSMAGYPPMDGGNYGNDGNFGAGRLPRGNMVNQGFSPHFSGYPVHYPTSHIRNPPSQQSLGEISSPLSLRQVLGENLEREIFPGDSILPSMEFTKEEPSSISKQWSAPNVPPPHFTQDNRYFERTSSSMWENTPQSQIVHSVATSSFQRQGEPPLISDLAASWPIWSSPDTSHQPQSPFSPARSHPTNLIPTHEKGWSSGNSPSALVDLMKRLDIAEHIPVLKNREISLDQLCNMNEEEWRELNLPVGPRVKLMNAICNKFHVSGNDHSFPSVDREDDTHGLSLTPPTCSPYVQ